jgi:Protein of unknown function (DUF1684)
MNMPPVVSPQEWQTERIGVACFALGETACELELYWLLGYGGGLFVPFADATSGEETYGAGGYLLDPIKGADLGTTAGWCSTSTSRTARRAPTTSAGRARWLRHRTPSDPRAHGVSV